MGLDRVLWLILLALAVTLAWHLVYVQPRRLERRRAPAFAAAAASRGLNPELASAIFHVLGRHDLDLEDELAYVLSRDEEELVEAVFLVLRDFSPSITEEQVGRLRLHSPQPLDTIADLVAFTDWCRVELQRQS